MKIEEAIGKKLAWLRSLRGLSQAQLGEALGQYLEKPWSRQAVNSAERGNRAFTARDLVALALALEVPVTVLLLPQGNDDVELPGGALSRGEYRTAVLHPSAGELSTVGESMASLKRAHAGFEQMLELHRRIGAELEFGLETLRVAAEQAGRSQPGEADGGGSDG